VDAAGLARERYISLTTFKRDGTAVSTPVWVGSDDGERLLVWTGAGTWKAKRIRRDPHVRVAPCDARGRPRGEAVDATARLLDDPEIAERVLRRKYRIQKPALDAFNSLVSRLRRRPQRRSVTIEIRLTPAA
jgi:uncharacterized protein